MVIMSVRFFFNFHRHDHTPCFGENMVEFGLASMAGCTELRFFRNEANGDEKIFCRKGLTALKG
jgi:hypothetical protein